MNAGNGKENNQLKKKKSCINTARLEDLLLALQ